MTAPTKHALVLLGSNPTKAEPSQMLFSISWGCADLQEIRPHVGGEQPAQLHALGMRSYHKGGVPREGQLLTPSLVPTQGNEEPLRCTPAAHRGETCDLNLPLERETATGQFQLPAPGGLSIQSCSTHTPSSAPGIGVGQP